MVINVISFIPYLKNISRDYHLEHEVTLGEFIQSLGIKWDDDVLIVVNRVIVSEQSILLNDGDQIELLIPLSGG
ncbi:hypothetical protein BKP37_14140 [Anaerobacillus alkalilacustris]|uniref:Molybdopterin synthase sulfur carrier subunit n=1 Tax=Anaerobacillus alkalilacustris TaxID=393763 RepID=A0A1S2LJ77_9BACI|nr:MoaD/ThiS family protein [Anaerobacillus alkalilacustris]OIJ12562.1 hypothetical protein BKP37_14140 [Anaerobacillus alkalilacustris]